MNEKSQKLTCEIELKPGETLTLPKSLIACIGSGRWVVTIEPISTANRNHNAFLNSYSPEDEGLYDDYPSR
ncbi:hypothetical protein [Spirulina sp. 06S082]|uniref:hypothetical protein n=1 Tax=Spirulina sp. 06S082 TaxID=3110248 RepID=UPI002B1F8E45|nr:hypothetical protein [Spirulina sp. 06S082]MEA5467825.1 hypothetical protein [Spirulina sp. 06S082]